MSHAPRLYLRMDVNLDQHPDYGGMVLLMCAANRQPTRGIFLDLSIVERTLGGKARARKFLEPRAPGKRPDVVQLEDGTYYLDAWEEWQEGDLTVAERVRRLRARRKGGAGAVPPALHPPLAPALPDRDPPLKASASGVGRGRMKLVPTQPSSAGETPAGAGVDDGLDGFVAEVLALYVRLPGTRDEPSHADRHTAASWHKRGYTFHEARAALLVATARRELRNHAEPLRPIGALAYFTDVLDELRAQPVEPGYPDYLAERLADRMKAPVAAAPEVES